MRYSILIVSILLLMLATAATQEDSVGYPADYDYSGDYRQEQLALSEVRETADTSAIVDALFKLAKKYRYGPGPRDSVFAPVREAATLARSQGDSASLSEAFSLLIEYYRDYESSGYVSHAGDSVKKYQRLFADLELARGNEKPTLDQRYKPLYSLNPYQYYDSLSRGFDSALADYRRIHDTAGMVETIRSQATLFSHHDQFDTAYVLGRLAYDLALEAEIEDAFSSLPHQMAALSVAAGDTAAVAKYLNIQMFPLRDTLYPFDSTYIYMFAAATYGNIERCSLQIVYADSLEMVARPNEYWFNMQMAAVYRAMGWACLGHADSAFEALSYIPYYMLQDSDSLFLVDRLMLDHWQMEVELLLGRNEEAIASAMRALRRIEESTPSDYLKGDALFTVGWAYLNDSNYSEAIDPLERGYRLLNQSPGDAPVMKTIRDTVETWKLLATAYRGLDRVDTALALYRKALDVAENRVHPGITDTLRMHIQTLEKSGAVSDN